MSKKIDRLFVLLSLPLEGRIISSSELVLRTGRCLSWHYKEEDRGRFPKRKKIGVRAVGWSGNEIAQWLSERGHDDD